MNDKDFFKGIKKESKEYSENITEGFPYFCLKVFWGDTLSTDGIEEALINLKTNDESIDGFFIDEKNKEINILQCKSCESEKNIKPLKKEWLAYIRDVPGKLKNDDFIDRHSNDRIKEIARDFKIKLEKGFKPRLHFFHLGNGNIGIEKHYKDEISYYGWHKIKDEYEEYLSKLDRTEPPEISVQLEFENIAPNISTHKSFVSIITGDELIRLRKAYRYKLFDKNLRFSLGKNNINEKIIETAKTEPDNFYFYNNGITITSKGFRFRPTNSTIKIEYPQIINGAQTVDAIYSAYKERENRLSRDNSKDSSEEVKKEFKKIKILFRIIQDTTTDGKKTSPFEEKVIKYNNSQNSIKETDFYANNPEQIKLQELFCNYGYFYEIKRGDRKYLEDNHKDEHNLLKKKKSDFFYWNEKINIEKLASLWMAYSHDPSLDKVQKGNIFGYADDKNYHDIFGNENKLSDEQVREMILAYNLFDVISKQTEIYGNNKKTGQILIKLSQISDQNNSAQKLKISFKNIKQIMQDSLIFNDEIKRVSRMKKVF